ncbi:MAG: ATP-binding protein [Sandaracinaceae bacterium]
MSSDRTAQLWPLPASSPGAPLVVGNPRDAEPEPGGPEGRGSSPSSERGGLEEIERLRAQLHDTNRGVLALYKELDEHARQLAEADQRKSDFLALLAHELRNPLAVASLALDELDDGPVAHTLRRQIGHLTRLVDDLLDVSRIARGKVVLDLEVVDLASLVDEALEDRRPLLASTGHDVAWVRPPRPVPVRADPVRLTQVLNNLLDNAAKYSPPDTTISVTVDVAGSDGARLRVRDEGRGLTDAERRRIFELFVQTFRDTEDEAAGLGIGLTLVRQLVRMQDGHVEVDSAGRGHGATFSVLLPLRDEATAAARSPAPAPAGSVAGRRVLMVEDDDDLRTLLAARLRRRGVEVTAATSGREALARFRPGAFDVVLSDLGLPEMDGYELGRRVRELDPGVRLVALSGYGAAQDQERSERAGFDAHLVKPLGIDALLAVLAATPG